MVPVKEIGEHISIMVLSETGKLTIPSSQTVVSICGLYVVLHRRIANILCPAWWWSPNINTNIYNSFLGPLNCTTVTLDDVHHCCSDKFPCLNGQGHCHTHSECAGSLICGTANCGTTGDLVEANCCTPRVSQCNSKPVVGDSCCSTTIPCSEGQGPCTADSQCEGGLICGNSTFCDKTFGNNTHCCTSYGGGNSVYR